MHLSTLRLFLAALLLLAIAGQGATREGIIGTDDRHPSDPTIWPFRAIGRLNLQKGGFCTGSIVGAGRVLAAGHCIPEGRTPGEQARSVQFLAGYAKGRYAAMGFGRSVLTAATHRRADVAGSPLAGHQNDWAVVELARGGQLLKALEPIPIRTGPVSELIGHSVVLAGYHHDRPSEQLVQSNCRILAVMPQSEVFLHDCDLTGRASGSPILVEENGAWSIVGIAIAYMLDGEIATGVGITVPADAASLP